MGYCNHCAQLFGSFLSCSVLVPIYVSFFVQLSHPMRYTLFQLEFVCCLSQDCQCLVFFNCWSWCPIHISSVFIGFNKTFLESSSSSSSSSSSASSSSSSLSSSSFRLSNYHVFVVVLPCPFVDFPKKCVMFGFLGHLLLFSSCFVFVLFWCH